MPRVRAMKGVSDSGARYASCGQRRTVAKQAEKLANPANSACNDASTDAEMVLSGMNGNSSVTWAGTPSCAEGSKRARTLDTAASASGTRTTSAVLAKCCLTFDMSGGPKGAKRPLGRPLDGGVRCHAFWQANSPAKEPTRRAQDIR